MPGVRLCGEVYEGGCFVVRGELRHCGATNDGGVAHCASERLMVNRCMGMNSHRRCTLGLLFVVAFFGAGCGGVDPTPDRLDGSSSFEFEKDDINRAENAGDAVKEYCAGAVSEAQRIGCESHVRDAEIP